MTFNGASFDGLARIAFDSDGSLDSGFYVCSGALATGADIAIIELDGRCRPPPSQLTATLNAGG